MGRHNATVVGCHVGRLYIIVLLRHLARVETVWLILIIVGLEDGVDVWGTVLRWLCLGLGGDISRGSIILFVGGHTLTLLVGII